MSPVARELVTCPLTSPPRSPQQLIVRRWLGRIGSHSWLIAQRGNRLVLVSLGTANEPPQLAIRELPVTSLRADYVAGTTLWLVGTTDSRTLMVDVDLAKAPYHAFVHDWDITPLDHVDALAISDERVLLGETDPVTHKFQLYDRSGRRIGPLVTMRSDEPLAASMRCHQDRCFAVGIEGSTPTRRGYVVRFQADGSTENELLGSERIASLKTAEFGDRTIVVWTNLERAGLFARSLDATGRLIGGRVELRGLPAPPVVFELLAAAPPRVAVRDIKRRWSVGMIDVDAGVVEDARTLAVGDLPQFTGAVTADGVAGVAFDSRIDYRIGVHGWSAEAWAVFIPTLGDGEPPLEVLPRTVGDGRGGLAAFPLVAPGRTAVLVIPQGFEMAPGGELIMMRGPCVSR